MAHTIAVIEDDQAIRDMYKIKFEQEGFRVVTAENGKLGLEVVQKTKPDIILLDIMMPEMRGDEMLEAMRKTDWGKNIKVIVLTNVSKDEATASIDQLGVSDYVVKAHYTPQEVVDTVKKVLRS